MSLPRRSLVNRPPSGMIREPADVLREHGGSMSEWNLMRACYGQQETDRNRRGNSGRVRAVRLAVSRSTSVVRFTSESGAIYYSLNRPAPAT